MIAFHFLSMSKLVDISSVLFEDLSKLASHMINNSIVVIFVHHITNWLILVNNLFTLKVKYNCYISSYRTSY